jgi:hypothetical protein
MDGLCKTYSADKLSYDGSIGYSKNRKYNFLLDETKCRVIRRKSRQAVLYIIEKDAGRDETCGRC